MNTEKNYKEINTALWDERTKHHVTSAFYDMEGFLKGNSSLKDIELALLGDVKGKSILHLQCHFGQDSLSLARMGAKVTGVDISPAAIEKAREINTQLGLDAEFIVSDVYDSPTHLDKQFDIVFTTYGTIGWMPDMNKWAGVISHFLKLGGKLVFAEFHPAVWMFDNDFTYVQYPYFNKEVIIENEEGTYADTGAPMKLESVGWNHDLGEVLQALIDSELNITHFKEYDYSPYECLKNMVAIGGGNYHIKGMEGKLPLVYSVVAVKK
jgi:2-polyprenyl-3-methyl-5-hydroxy-6-metoxy-1,4-benzoquinol methylase